VSKNSGVQRPNTDTLSWVHPWRATADDGIPRGGTECSLGRWGASWILLHTIDLVIRVRKGSNWILKGLQGGRAHPLAACGLATLRCVRGVL
jgi:hypothetical protein